MKTISLIIIMIFIIGCTEKTLVTSIDQIPGKWKWESTCGGIIYECAYPSKSNNATIEFTSDAKYIEMHNDTIYLQTDYSIIKVDDTFGTLLLEHSAISLPITILNNRLLITRGELLDSYIKIK
jgi:hypothetical protein